ncbi:thiamine pyrophosphate-binding protein [Mesorhizobium qingshengii]|uniref:Acetolactate synthase-1/2/3 large subunit n=1 Tax=Mesorhizobium qingshengii TaxID=1165689 RepID=A0A1G5Z9V0_9HYPH|nr:thiamine pyrophosphate-binding protein [Mesorhizobium qingshengii]SDA91366.1 acetolactate synthase-1/2/3 large subunit [Mesorhizobium qingshengii]
MNGADALLMMLREYGVEVIFGVPGDTNVALYHALKRMKDAPVHVVCRDERSAVFMADCYARVSGKPGIAEVPSGAGAMYGLPGIAEANKSSVPLILLVNDIPQLGVGRGTLTELPIEAMFRPISKHAETLNRVEKLPETIRRAFRLATAGRPGAVVLALPEDLLYEELDATPHLLRAEPQCRSAPAFRVLPEEEIIGRASEALISSKRPLIVAGGGANRSAAGESLVRLAEHLNIPIATTITGQGVISDDHRLAIGIIGDNGFHPHAVWALGEADLVIYVGCRMGSVATMNWKWPPSDNGAKIIQIDLDPDIIANTRDVDFPLMGDARATIDRFFAKTKGESLPARDWVVGINSRRIEFWRTVQSELRSREVPIRPERVIEALNQHLPAKCHVMSDAGTSTPYATRFLKLTHPGSKLVIPRFFGGLGYAIPAVVGAYFAAPEFRPVALFGDGSLGMSAGELETLARLEVPAVLIHFNNGCFGWIKALQRVMHKGEGNDGTFGVEFGRHDMSKLAAVYGIRNFRVDTIEQLDGALKQSFALQEPCFIDVAVESIADRLPPVHSWLKKFGVDPGIIGVQATF